jgi:quinol monooxygenase YgiN
MSTLVTNEFYAQPDRGDDVVNLLIEILGENLQFDGCETIRIVRDQDDPDHVAGVTQWTERKNFEDYLGWRTERRFTADFEARLTRPFVIHHYDIAYFGEGVASARSAHIDFRSTAQRRWNHSGRSIPRGTCPTLSPDQQRQPFIQRWLGLRPWALGTA